MRNDSSNSSTAIQMLQQHQGIWEVLMGHEKPMPIEDWTGGRSIVDIIVTNEWEPRRKKKKEYGDAKAYPTTIRFTPRYSWSSVTVRRSRTWISDDSDEFMDTHKSKASAPALPNPVEKDVQTIEASPTPLPEVGEILGLTSHRRGISDVTVRAEREEEDAANRYGTEEVANEQLGAVRRSTRVPKRPKNI
jgi:hypothetical protein